MSRSKQANNLTHTGLQFWRAALKTAQHISTINAHHNNGDITKK